MPTCLHISYCFRTKTSTTANQHLFQLKIWLMAIYNIHISTKNAYLYYKDLYGFDICLHMSIYPALDAWRWKDDKKNMDELEVRNLAALWPLWLLLSPLPKTGLAHTHTIFGNTTSISELVCVSKIQCFSANLEADTSALAMSDELGPKMSEARHQCNLLEHISCIHNMLLDVGTVKQEFSFP